MVVEEDWNINMSIHMYTSIKHQGHCVVTIEPPLASGMSYRLYTRHFFTNKMSFRLLRAGGGGGGNFCYKKAYVEIRCLLVPNQASEHNVASGIITYTNYYHFQGKIRYKKLGNMTEWLF
jgi:hypothetical protein